LWGQYIVGVCDTPREIKRALNDLRYQAMTRRSNGPSATRGERLVRSIRQFVTGRPEKAPAEARVDEAALPPLKAAALADLTDSELQYFLGPDTLDIRTSSENLKLLIQLKIKHMEQFKRWLAEAQPAAAGSGADIPGSTNAPPAPAGQHQTENRAANSAKQA